MIVGIRGTTLVVEWVSLRVLVLLGLGGSLRVRFCFDDGGARFTIVIGPRWSYIGKWMLPTKGVNGEGVRGVVV